MILEGDEHRLLMAKQRLCPSNTRGWFRQFSHRGFWRCIFQLVMLCAMCADTWVLTCMVFVFCVKEADWGMMAFGA